MTIQAGPTNQKKPKIVLIVAMARNRVIGNNGALPWNLPADLQRFRSLTMGHPIIMGRKTYESIGRPLPGRRNIVISRNLSLAIDGVETATSLQSALDMVTNADQAFVIGGQQIFQAALPLADRVELTLIDSDFEGDVLFPEIDAGEWAESQPEPGESSDSGLEYHFIRLDRTRKR